jgi:CheY-like chemotaxis protein
MSRTNATILVVDDNEASRYATVRQLEAGGFRTLPAETGEQALSLADFASAVVLDVHLPDLHGFEVCRLLKQKKPRTPIVHLSAVYVARPYQRAGTWAGADAYLVSPVEPAELLETLDRLIDRPIPAPL